MHQLCPVARWQKNNGPPSAVLAMTVTHFRSTCTAACTAQQRLLQPQMEPARLEALHHTSAPLLTRCLCRTFTWRNVAIGYLVYAIPGIFGITLCYHRMLTHRSFKTYK